MWGGRRASGAAGLVDAAGTVVCSRLLGVPVCHCSCRRRRTVMCILIGPPWYLKPILQRRAGLFLVRLTGGSIVGLGVVDAPLEVPAVEG